MGKSVGVRIKGSFTDRGTPDNLAPGRHAKGYGLSLAVLANEGTEDPVGKGDRLCH
jgi:hypothetical protein